ncbi:SapC family protein [Flavobacterium sp. W21_SRS_FM6]|uniref:SapC family protein n=1 Tax=Flavobacterium sp. W21_SRS_FM6 TaxID=3240268 RepID=UPI003F8E7C63
MPNHQQLDNITHKNLRVLTHHHPNFGDTTSYSRLFTSEFRHAQGDYPILFRKNSETGQFEAIALFGFAVEENLFLDDHGWHANYIPLAIQRRPFLIGFEPGSQESQGEPKAVVHIDMDSPRISESEGEAVFLEQGGQSHYLQQVSSVLNAIHQGDTETRAFIDTLLHYELIESVSIKVKLQDGSNNELSSLYSINEEKLTSLAADAVYSLYQRGYMQHIYMVMASMAAMSHLIELKNKQISSTDV